MANNSLSSALKDYAKGLTQTPIANDIKNLATDIWNNRNALARNYLAEQYMEKRQNGEITDDTKAGSTTEPIPSYDIGKAYETAVPFINAYRDALGRQRDLNKQAIDNNRRNYYQNLMGSANTLGMMYSNFPERAKIQYDTNTYMPDITANQDTYQTGLDKLRTNTVSYLNQLQEINEAIEDMAKTSTTDNSGDANYLQNLYEQLGKLYGTTTE